jgi:AraC family transcriptional regulator of adaptative response/methylated-DNA-[protein]-cysteine methyltransferase
MVERTLARDRAADDRFVVGRRWIGAYCLPSCRPPWEPGPDDLVFFASAEEARAAGFWACRLCEPDGPRHTRRTDGASWSRNDREAVTG